MYVGDCVYLIYTDDTKTDLQGFVYPGAEFRATKVDGTPVGQPEDSIDQAASHLEA